MLMATSGDADFDTFWHNYPRKVAKVAALKAWQKIKPDAALVQQMLDAVLLQRYNPSWTEPRFIPHPATWLNGARWTDAPPSPTSHELAVAKRVRQNARGGCWHDPPCSDWQACVLTIVQEIRLRDGRE